MAEWLTKLHNEFQEIKSPELCNLVEQVYDKIISQPQGESDAHLSIPHTLAAIYFAKKLCGCFSVSSEDKELILACCLIWGAVGSNGLGSQIQKQLISSEPGGLSRKLGDLLRSVKSGSRQSDPLLQPAMIVLLSLRILSPQGQVLQSAHSSKKAGAFRKAA